MNIRRATIDDLSDLQTLFVETIKEVCRSEYSPSQIDVWTSSVNDRERWINAIEEQYFIVAEEKGEIHGFGSLKEGKHIDFFYVHKDHQREGVGNKIYEALEKEAESSGSEGLFGFVSKTAKPFFDKKGFRTAQEKRNIIHGVEIQNYRMVKVL